MRPVTPAQAGICAGGEGAIPVIAGMDEGGTAAEVSRDKTAYSFI